MNPRLFLMTTLAALFLSVSAHSEPLPDRLLGKVNIRDSVKIDAKAKKELAAIAVRIKKSRNKGAVKIVGNVPSAESQEDYISKSVFLARNVEAKLKPLLSGKYQLFITASKYSGEKSAGPSFVEIYLYPYELRVEGAGFSSSQVTSDSMPKDQNAHLPPVQTDTQTSADDGLLTRPPADDEAVEVTSRKERLQNETEDSALADDLVSKAKARAAEKMKRLEREQ